MANKNIVAFGPSLVDVHAELEAEPYAAALEYLGAQPGDWIPLEHADNVTQLADIITNGQRFGSITAHGSESCIQLQVGCSLLNMLGAMPSALREQSTLATAHAVQGTEADPLASYFSQTVASLGIHHLQQQVTGQNPVGFVITGPNTTEKTMAMHSGVTTELAPQELALKEGDWMLVDAYELRTGKLADYLDALIASGGLTVALSLGNHTILEQPLVGRIRGYLEQGKITAVCGNAVEYSRLFPDVTAEMHTKAGFAEHPVRRLARHALITYGADGMAAHSDGEFNTAESEHVAPEDILSTAGAGDVTAGSFYTGILQGDTLPATLANAAIQGARALRINNGLINLPITEAA